MLKEYDYVLRKINYGVDFALSLLALYIAHLLRHFLAVFIVPQFIGPAGFFDYGPMPFILPVLTLIVLSYNGYYRSQRLRLRLWDTLRLVAVSCLQITALMMIAIYISGNIISRPLLLLIPFSLFALLSAKTLLLRRSFMEIRRRGFNYRTVIVVGSGEPLRRFINTLEAHSIWGLKIEGVITDREGEFQSAAGDKPQRVFGYPLIGDLACASDAIAARQVDEVVFTPQIVPLERLVPLMEACETMGIRTHLPLHYFEGQIARPVIDYFDEIPVISYYPTREMGPALFFKYAFDRAFGALLLIVLAVPLALVALAIKLTSPRDAPVFFVQKRLGLNGRSFRCWKFRTMSVDAEARREELEALNEVDGPVFKIRHDPRVTRLGRFLRKFSIDELPQLVNVVRGEMSLVGPRPPLPQEYQRYDRWHRRRLSMKPGITCLWQVSGRSHLNFDAWMKLDLEYIDNWSLLLDLKILLRTVYVVLTGYGAM